jgi:hypothetical protein
MNAHLSERMTLSKKKKLKTKMAVKNLLRKKNPKIKTKKTMNKNLIN